tara:strand:- start:1382 stop:1555 length:174 start_codon:yes stop_codon:yes gene_type:complete
MNVNYHLLIDIILISGAVPFVLFTRKLKNKNPWNQSGGCGLFLPCRDRKKVFSITKW